MKYCLLLCFLLCLSCFANEEISCEKKRGDKTIGVANLCMNVPGRPNCINIAPTTEAPKFVCRECDQNCDCPVDSYCVKSTGKNAKNETERGNCKKIDPNTTETRIGKPFIRFNFVEHDRYLEEPKIPIKGVDDQLVCGIAIFSDLDTFDGYEWLGYCKQGICRTCASWGPDLDQTLNYYQEHEPSSLLCPGRSCVGGQLTTPDWAQEKENTQKTTWISVQTPESINAAILAFVVLLTLMNAVMCMCTVRNSFGPRKYKQVSQKL